MGGGRVLERRTRVRCRVQVDRRVERNLPVIISIISYLFRSQFLKAVSLSDLCTLLESSFGRTMLPLTFD